MASGLSVSIKDLQEHPSPWHQPLPMPKTLDKKHAYTCAHTFFGLLGSATAFCWQIIFLHDCISQIVSSANRSLLPMLCSGSGPRAFGERHVSNELWTRPCTSRVLHFYCLWCILWGWCSAESVTGSKPVSKGRRRGEKGREAREIFSQSDQCHPLGRPQMLRLALAF